MNLTRRSRQIVITLVAGAAAVAVTVWLTYPKTTSFIGDPSKYRFMHCSRCSKEVRFDVDHYAAGCQKCGGTLTPTAEPIAVTGKPPSPYFRMATWVLVDLIGVMAAILWVTRRPLAGPDEDFLYMNCDKCRQKIRYREQQIGLAAMCRRCKHAFIYPEEGPDCD